MPRISRMQLRNALATVDYPMDKDDLVRHAEQSNAGEAVQKALCSLPPVDYRNFDEVLRSVKADVGSGETSAQHADPQRRPTRPGVAEDLR